MHYFISAGEPSGDTHGQNLIEAIRKQDPEARFSGFGGPKMESAGCQLLYPLVNLSVMWFLHVIRNIFTFLRLKSQAARFFQDQKPDVVVLIDYPGFHWHIAKKARQAGIPVIYFVPPQLWAWAGWRIHKMKRSVDCVLSALPFEHQWYQSRGMRSTFIGHPFFDDIAEKKLDDAWIAEQKQKNGPIIALLPGSRRQEVTKNFADIVDAACRVYRQRPDCRFLVASYNEAQADLAREMLIGKDLPAEIVVGKTSEILDICHSVIAVSGSVSLEVMVRRKPAVILYRLKPLDLRLGRFFMKCRYITLVNLLAEREVYPEFLTAENKAIEMSQHVLNWLNQPETYVGKQAELDELIRQFVTHGACEKAAATIVDWVRPQANTLSFRQAA